MSGLSLPYLSNLYHVISPFLGLLILFISLGIALCALTGALVAYGRGQHWALGLILGLLLGPLGVLVIGIISIAQDRQAMSEWSAEVS